MSGSPSASESSSRAPGIKPTEGVEGSGIEGSGGSFPLVYMHLQSVFTQFMTILLLAPRKDGEDIPPIHSLQIGMSRRKTDHEMRGGEHLSLLKYSADY